MMNKLRGRLILLILGGTIFSILLVSIITNVTLFKQFDTYRMKEQKTHINQILQMVEQSYQSDEAWTRRVIENIKTSPIISSYDVIIKNDKGDVIFTHYMRPGMMKYHNDMMRRMGQGMMGRNLRGEDYVRQVFDIQGGEGTIGTVEIGYNGPFIVSEQDIEFTRDINRSIIYASIFSIIAAIIIGILSSSIFSKPILKITEAANEIRRGKLDTQVAMKGSIVELNELSNAINHLAVSLKSQHELRKQLTSDISHELRTPLTILGSHAEALIDGVWEPTPERLSVFKKEITRLMKLVEQLKNLNEIESRRTDLEFSNFNFSKVLQEVVETFRYNCDDKDIKLIEKIPEEIMILGDRDKIKQVFINLISNACKYTNGGGQVELTVIDQRDRIKIEVKDSGIGISQEDLPYIFERLYRADKSRSRKTGGAGIGLAVVKTLVHGHNGKISVKSQEGKGTIVTVILPKVQRMDVGNGDKMND